MESNGLNYEAPAVEIEVSESEIDRQVHYAGGMTIVPE